VNEVLIEFRVKNFRSLRDEQVLSLVASKDDTLMDTHTMATGIKAAPHLLRSSVMYGANASGKSNVVKALSFMRFMVVRSAQMQADQLLPAQPFRLDETSKTQASEFEVTFLLEGVRYQYGFAITAQRVVSEHLLIYKTAKAQLWLERSFDAEKGADQYKPCSSLKGAKQVWESATRPNALFLSTAVQLNSESLKPVFEWFSKHLVVISHDHPLHQDRMLRHTVDSLKSAEKRKAICDLMQAADISIADIDVVSQKAQRPTTIRFDHQANEVSFSDEMVEVDEDALRFHHVSSDGSKAVFDLEEESTGTLHLLKLAGPVLDILSTDTKASTLVIDELDANLHPLLLRQLVGLFHEPSVNQSGAQLVFTTHDTSLLNAEALFRRDQVWLVEKGSDQASKLMSLSEFSPRKNEAIERGYLMGRYGGVPMIGHLMGLSH
jgi:uncharacterized protein